jgi:hypothetical protein
LVKAETVIPGIGQGSSCCGTGKAGGED